ncbi:G patch domain-containing protein 11-like [Homarus americanus]|uniref:G patch domain-containing protein 11-like n=1 Tax=Homarus americanus TaxID=6706 RepID=UPI001C4842BB|nr:G patch domain-containing protein 11-like [Homarus americanus]
MGKPLSARQDLLVICFPTAPIELKEPRSVGKDDIRPGLMFSHSSKRQAEMEKKKKIKDVKQQTKFKTMKEVQKERLEEGLSTAISSSNKGFSMLQKMGYKPGTSLGKQKSSQVMPVILEW